MRAKRSTSQCVSFVSDFSVVFPDMSVPKPCIVFVFEFLVLWGFSVFGFGSVHVWGFCMVYVAGA